MTRKEYMQDLENRLQGLDEEARQKALDFYGEALADRMEDGMDEASAVAAMETPEDIAARLMAENGGLEAEEQKQTEDASIPLTDEAMKFSSLAESVIKAAEKAVEAASGVAEKAVEAASGIAAQAEKTAEQAMDQAEQKTFSDYEQKVLTCGADQLRRVRLIGGEMPVQVRACNGNDITLVYYTREDDPYEAGITDGVLTLQRRERESKGPGRFTFSLLGGIIRMGWNRACPAVELTVPRDVLLDLEVHTSNASIRVSGPKALCDVNLKTGNSRIALEDVTCKALEAVSSNGRLAMEGVQVKQSLNGKTSNSRIEAKHVACGGDLILRTSNGAVETVHSFARGEVRLTTSNGRIRVESTDGGAMHLQTSNGSISGTLPGRQTDWQISSGTSNGRNSLPASQPGSKPLTVRTSNGSIDLGFEG